MAVAEWDVVGVEEDDSSSTTCTCGKHGLKYIFTIQNTENGNFLSPIGSECINRFGRDDLRKDATAYQQYLFLLNYYKKYKYLELKSDVFSKKLLKMLFEKGAFKPTQYNKNNPRNDYEFLVSMFNKRSAISDKQQKRVNAIMVTEIVPFIRKKLEVGQQ